MANELSPGFCEEKYVKIQSSFTEFLDLSMKSIWIYYDYLVFEEKYVHVKIRAVQNVLAVEYP